MRGIAALVWLTGSGAVSPPKPRTPVRHLATVDDFEDFLQHSGYQTSVLAAVYKESKSSVSFAYVIVSSLGLYRDKREEDWVALTTDDMYGDDAGGPEMLPTPIQAAYINEMSDPKILPRLSRMDTNSTTSTLDGVLGKKVPYKTNHVYVVEPTRAQSFRPQEEWNQQQPGANHEYYDSILKRAFAGEPKVASPRADGDL
jgi:hypothetical protein